MMTLLNISPGHIVFEVGAGSDYQATILGRLAKKVYSTERIPELAPFDAIMVTAVDELVPPMLVDQLESGARIVIPVDLHGYSQELILTEKDSAGEVQQRNILPVAFVPLIESG